MDICLAFLRPLVPYLSTRKKKEKKKLYGNWKNGDSGLDNSLNCWSKAILTELRTDKLDSFIGANQNSFKLF